MIRSRVTLLLLACALTSSLPVFSQVELGVSISANIAPPALPVYSQPVCPNDGYIWTPGYWAYSSDGGYYWVPGVWVSPPQVGYLWTPCYWGYEGGVYGFHNGYWGSHIGFYGGVNYGYGYGGVGYGGGMWSGGSFRYNTAVSNVNVTIVHNTYVNRSVVNNTGSRTSFNGPGGVSARPSPQEASAMHEHHIQPTGEQASHQQTARQDRNQFANVNHGKPATVAMNKVGGQHFNNAGKPAGAPAAQHNQSAPQHGGTPGNGNAQHQQAARAPQQQAARQQQQSRPQPQQSRPQPQQAHPQPQQPRPQPQQQRPQPQQSRPQPQQSHPQPQQSHSEGRPEGGGERR